MIKISKLTLYQIISTTFCVVVLIANLVSAKMVKMPFLQDVILPAGLIFYPISFLLNDLVTEFYGVSRAKTMVYVSLIMNLVTLGLIEIAMLLPNVSEAEQYTFNAILGLSGMRIFASLTAYLFSQIIDIQLYTLIKQWTGRRLLWVRSNGSTCASQLLDTIIVDMIYLYWGLGMHLSAVVPIICFSYAYKVFFSFASTPLFYFCVHLIQKNRKKDHFSLAAHLASS